MQASSWNEKDILFALKKMDHQLCLWYSSGHAKSPLPRKFFFNAGSAEQQE
jgi:hypothetical protein